MLLDVKSKFKLLQGIVWFHHIENVLNGISGSNVLSPAAEQAGSY